MLITLKTSTSAGPAVAGAASPSSASMPSLGRASAPARREYSTGALQLPLCRMMSRKGGLTKGSPTPQHHEAQWHGWHALSRCAPQSCYRIWMDPPRVCSKIFASLKRAPSDFPPYSSDTHAAGDQVVTRAARRRAQSIRMSSRPAIHSNPTHVVYTCVYTRGLCIHTVDIYTV